MKKFVIGIIGIAILFFATATVYANHSWAGYHWARTSNPFTLKLGDNVSSTWDPILATTSADWSSSLVLDTTIVTGKAKANCRPTPGQVEVCNKAYGNNGWLGVAQVWVNGTHITQATTKMNDTYFSTSTYNTTAWRNLVMCQEVGHTLGLDHQDENFTNSNLGTCMDYTNDPFTNQHPNQHDYDELAIIYSHFDTITTVSQSSAQLAKQISLEVSDNPGEWGKKIKTEGRNSIYERDFGDGNKMVTFVVWAN